MEKRLGYFLIFLMVVLAVGYLLFDENVRRQPVSGDICGDGIVEDCGGETALRLRDLADMREFGIGTILDLGNSNPYISPIYDLPTYREVLVDEYNLFYTARDFKQIHYTKGGYDFRFSDRDIDFANENEVKIIWLDQIFYGVPDWLEDIKDSDDPNKREVMIELLKDYVQTTVNRYKGKVYGWNFVGYEQLFRYNPWHQVIGDDYFTLVPSFVLEADPDARLYFGMTIPPQPEDEEVEAKNILSDLINQGIPFQGVILNAYWIQPHEFEDDTMEKMYDEYGDLGLDVHVIDARVMIEDLANAEDLQRQAVTYGAAARICLEHPACKSLTPRRVTDRNEFSHLQWGQKRGSFIFDDKYRPKPAYYSIREVVSEDLDVCLVEKCDDGNLEYGDGCNSYCSVEKGWDCQVEHGVCNYVGFLTKGVGLVVDIAVQKEYQFGILDIEKKAYVDREYEFINVPEKYIGLQYLRTFNDDKIHPGDSYLIDTRFDEDVRGEMFVFVDDRVSHTNFLPAGFDDNGDDILVEDIFYSVFEKDINDGESVKVNGQGGGGATSNFVVAFDLEGVRVEEDHFEESDPGKVIFNEESFFHSVQIEIPDNSSPATASDYPSQIGDEGSSIVDSTNVEESRGDGAKDSESDETQSSSESSMPDGSESGGSTSSADDSLDEIEIVMREQQDEGEKLSTENRKIFTIASVSAIILLVLAIVSFVLYRIFQKGKR